MPRRWILLHTSWLGRGSPVRLRIEDQRNSMRMAIWPAILAVAPVICFGMELAQKAAPDAAKEQTQSAQSQAAPAAEGGDPSKLAMPASAQGTLANDRSFVI